jgi:hypothetical protein
LKKRLCQLKNHLKRRGYKQSIIKKSFNTAHNISRSSLLQYKEKQKCKRTPCVLTYHPCLRNSFNTIREHGKSVEKKIQNCPKSFLSLPWLPSNNQTVCRTSDTTDFYRQQLSPGHINGPGKTSDTTDFYCQQLSPVHINGPGRMSDTTDFYCQQLSPAHINGPGRTSDTTDFYRQQLLPAHINGPVRTPDF